MGNPKNEPLIILFSFVRYRISKCMQLKKRILDEGQKSKTLRYCSKFVHRWENFQNLKNIDIFHVIRKHRKDDSFDFLTNACLHTFLYLPSLPLAYPFFFLSQGTSESSCFPQRRQLCFY